MPIGSPQTVFSRGYIASGLPAAATTVETVIATFGPLVQGVPPGLTPSPVRVSGIYNITPGTAATAVQIRLRQGTTTAGALVGVAQQTQVIATDAISIPYAFQDTSGYLQTPAGGSYCITAQQVSATANGTSNQIEWEASG
jgi:small nuclear ribonucleoprotein (snRNP)-like protein